MPLEENDSRKADRGVSPGSCDCNQPGKTRLPAQCDTNVEEITD